MGRRILITGGAGFVGSNLGIALRQHDPDNRLVAFDNLHRRGSELSLPRLREHGVEFRHGDIRCREDLDELPRPDIVIDCSAEPSVHAGLAGSPMAPIASNLGGTVNCLELARRHDAAFLFLSTSRVYPIERVNALAYRESSTRFEWLGATTEPGFSPSGITEEFSLTGPRSLYGTTKLASEMLLQEYAYSFAMPVLINRCGVLAGPWQMGKVDQGVLTLWVARHLAGRGLDYIGFGGTGKQVRDVLHIVDLCDLVIRQLDDLESWNGSIYNVGGGVDRSTSLVELTQTCREVTGRSIPIGARPETNPVDVRIFIVDSSHACRAYGWEPVRTVTDTVREVADWIRAGGPELSSVLG